MTRVIDYSAPGDHRTVVQAALDAIREPLLVGLPSESGYLLATSSVNAEGVSRLIHLAQSVKRPLSLCLAEAGQIEDYLDRVPPQAMRLAQRSWPGPVILEFESTSQWVGPPLAAPLTEFLKISLGDSRALGIRFILACPGFYVNRWWQWKCPHRVVEPGRRQMAWNWPRSGANGSA